VRRADMHRRAARAGHGRALLEGWSAAVRRVAIPHAGARASAVAAEDFTVAAVEGVRAVVAAVAGINRDRLISIGAAEI